MGTLTPGGLVGIQFTRAQKDPALSDDSSGLPGEEGAVWEGFLGTTGLEGWEGQKQAGIGNSGRHRQFAALLRGWRCGRVGK